MVGLKLEVLMAKPVLVVPGIGGLVGRGTERRAWQL